MVAFTDYRGTVIDSARSGTASQSDKAYFQIADRLPSQNIIVTRARGQLAKVHRRLSMAEWAQQCVDWWSHLVE